MECEGFAGQGVMGRLELELPLARGENSRKGAKAQRFVGMNLSQLLSFFASLRLCARPFLTNAFHRVGWARFCVIGLLGAALGWDGMRRWQGKMVV